MTDYQHLASATTEAPEAPEAVRLYDVYDAAGHRILEAQRLDTVHRFMRAHEYHPYGPLLEWRHDTHAAPLNYARAAYVRSVPPEEAPAPTFEAMLLRGRFTPGPQPESELTRQQAIQVIQGELARRVTAQLRDAADTIDAIARAFSENEQQDREDTLGDAYELRQLAVTYDRLAYLLARELEQQQP